MVHTCNVKLKGWQRTQTERLQKSSDASEENESLRDIQVGLDNRSPDMSFDGQYLHTHGTKLDAHENESVVDGSIDTNDVEENNACEQSNIDGGEVSEKTYPGVLWDVFRRPDVPKVAEYLRIHWKEFGKTDIVSNDFVSSVLTIP